jgi:hypothetical protein
MTEIQAKIATEGELWPDGKTVLAEDSLTWRDPIPVTYGFDPAHLIGKASNIHREGNEIHATLELDSVWTKTMTESDEGRELFSLAYSVGHVEMVEGYHRTISKGQLRGVSVVPTNGANPRRETDDSKE